MDYIQLSVTVGGFLLSLCVNITAVAFAFGLLHGRVTALEKNIARNDTNDNEIFMRLRELENVTPRLEDAAARFEKVLSNGINDKIADMTTRIRLMEQHCADTHHSQQWADKSQPVI